MKIEENAIYTYQEVQEIFGVKKTALSALIAQGALKPIQIGKSYRFLGSQLLKFCNDQLFK